MLNRRNFVGTTLGFGLGLGKLARVDSGLMSVTEADDQTASTKPSSDWDRTSKVQWRGIPTGFTDLDSLTGGLRDGDLILLAAQRGVGATALARNIVEHVAMEVGLPTLYLSLDQSGDEIVDRILCSQARVDHAKFRTGFLSVGQRKRLDNAYARFRNSPLIHDDAPDRTVAEIAACARGLLPRGQLRLMVIDFLQLILPDNPREPRRRQFVNVTRQLKELARELCVPILCLAQLKSHGNAGRSDPLPTTTMPVSRGLDRYANVVMSVRRGKDEFADLANVIVSKQNNGPIGAIRLTWLEKYASFEDLA